VVEWYEESLLFVFVYVLYDVSVFVVFELSDESVFVVFVVFELSDKSAFVVFVELELSDESVFVTLELSDESLLLFTTADESSLPSSEDESYFTTKNGDND
jgi:hypothetical protein